MTLEQFVQKNTGKFIEVAGSANAKNQCVDLANAYIRDVLGLPIIEWTDAVNFPLKADKTKYDWIENTPTGYPLPGDIVIFKQFPKLYGSVGHIAIVTKADSKSLTVFEQNYPTGSPCKIGIHTYSGCVGWLRAKQVKPDVKPEIKVDENLQKVLDYYKVKTSGELIIMVDEQLKYLADARLQVSELKSQLDGAKAAELFAKEARQSFIDKVAGIIGSTADEANIIKRVTEDRNQVDGLIKAKDELKDQLETVKSANAEEITLLKQQVKEAKEVIESLTKRLTNMQTRIEELENKKTVENGFWKSLNEILNRIKGMK